MPVSADLPSPVAQHALCLGEALMHCGNIHSWVGEEHFWCQGQVGSPHRNMAGLSLSGFCCQGFS